MDGDQVWFDEDPDPTRRREVPEVAGDTIRDIEECCHCTACAEPECLADSGLGPGVGGARVVVWFPALEPTLDSGDRKSTRLNSSHVAISYAVFCLKKKK